MSSGAYSFAFDDVAHQAEVEGPTAIPVNSRIVRVRIQGDDEMVFVRNAEMPNLLAAAGGWKAIERPEQKMLNAFVGEEGAANRRELCFINGLLRYMSVGKKDYELDPSKWIAPTNSIESLWPTAKTHEIDLRNNDIWKGDRRFRLFSRNPNRTALLFAHLVLIAFGFTLFSRCCIVRILSLLVSIGSFVAVIATQSRGGLLALVAGIVVLLYFRLRNCISRRMVGCLMLGVFVVATMAYAFLFLRGTPEEIRARDESKSDRLYMWREVPRMVAAAPLGWGLWKSGPAYNSWFESPSRMHMTGDLFNDHLSRFVEGGYVFGGLYIFAWVLLFALGWRYAWIGGSPVPLAICASYWLAACFNPMLYWKPSLYIPIAVFVVFLIGVGCRRPLAALNKLRQPLMISAIITIVVLGSIATVVACSGGQDVPLRVSALGRRVVVGKGDPAVWIADDGFVLSGDYYGFPGKELRDFYRKYPNAEAMGLVENLGDLPDNVSKLVLTGTFCREFLSDPGKIKAGQVILYSPPFPSKDIKPAVRTQYGIEVLTGKYAAGLTGDDRTRKKWVHVVPGTELYVPNWPSMVVRRNGGR